MIFKFHFVQLTLISEGTDCLKQRAEAWVQVPVSVSTALLQEVRCNLFIFSADVQGEHVCQIV
jgi:hypothetical protein